MEKKIFVSAAGCDERGTGTIENPFATLQRAVECVRKQKETKAHILFREGIYFFSSPVVLGCEDSGLTIQNYGEEKVVFSGARRLSALDWMDYEGNPCIKKARIPSGLDLHAVLNENPDFADVEANNYTVRNEKILKSIGFQNFPMDQFGKAGCSHAAPVYIPSERERKSERRNSSQIIKFVSVD